MTSWLGASRGPKLAAMICAAVFVQPAVLVLLHLAIFGLWSSVPAKGAELPTLAELRNSHAELREASSSLQGTIQTFRSEAANPAAFEKMPAELGIPLIRSGTLWRTEGRFRADYESHRQTGVIKESKHSVAVDGGKVYQLSINPSHDAGDLRVYDKGTPEAATAMKFIEAAFYRPVSVLWSMDGTAFLDILQRPGSKTMPSKMFADGVSMLVPWDDGAETRFEFGPGKHPFKYYHASAGEGDMQVTAERRVFSVEKDGVLLPERVVDVVSIGPSGGYTEVVLLDLKMIEPGSPVAKPVTSASFQNMGFAYQVYNIRAPGKEELAERYEGSNNLPKGEGSGFR